jgi:hypothetical protein
LARKAHVASCGQVHSVRDDCTASATGRLDRSIGFPIEKEEIAKIVEAPTDVSA